jgi:hypothetical protein
LLLLGALVAVTATACQVRTTVAVDVVEDGSGTVTVAVGLDADALRRVPDVDDDGRSTAADLGGLVRTDDLAAAGWQVSEPTGSAADDGFVWIRATKPFGTPEEAGEVLGEITGTDGPLRDLRVGRDDSFARSHFTFEGTADLSGGLEAFGDEGLAGALQGEALGQDASAIEEELGLPLAEMFTLEISAELPDTRTRRRARGHGGDGNRPGLVGPGALGPGRGVWSGAGGRAGGATAQSSPGAPYPTGDEF